jgi:indolepyruvate ferredoxin oxidoreductase beta subunit
MSEAKKLGNAKVFNVIIVGVAAKHMEFEKEQWIKVIRNTVPAKLADLNVQAFEAGYAV